MEIPGSVAYTPPAGYPSDVTRDIDGGDQDPDEVSAATSGAPSKSMPPGSTGSLYWADGNVPEQDADVVVLDSEELNKDTVDELHAQGKQVIAYISAGTLENWRNDANAFPQEAVGNAMEDWPDENYLNINDAAVQSAMANRIDNMSQLGVDGIEFDNVDTYTADTGFSISKDDQVNYIRFLADETHSRGMMYGLKNSMDLIPDVADVSDFAINEQGFEYGDDMQLYQDYFINQGKAAFYVGYSGDESELERARSIGMDAQMGSL